MGKTGFLDVEVYDKKGDWEQGYFLVHGWDDVLWTDSVDDVINYLREELEKELKMIVDGEQEMKCSYVTCSIIKYIEKHSIEHLVARVRAEKKAAADLLTEAASLILVLDNEEDKTREPGYSGPRGG